MKTKELSSGITHTLFEEEGNTSFIHLQLKNPVYIKLEAWEASEKNLTLGIPIEAWREITENWAESQWAKDPEKDNTGYDE